MIQVCIYIYMYVYIYILCLLGHLQPQARILPKVVSGARSFVKHLYKICGPDKIIAPRMLLKITAMNSSLKLVLDSEISYDDLGTHNKSE